MKVIQQEVLTTETGYTKLYPNQNVRNSFFSKFFYTKTKHNIYEFFPSEHMLVNFFCQCYLSFNNNVSAINKRYIKQDHGVCLKTYSNFLCWQVLILIQENLKTSVLRI